MDNSSSPFFREIDKEERNCLIKNGKIKYHDGEINSNFDFLSYTDETIKDNDDFYRILRKTVKRVDDPPIAMIIIMYLFAIAFFAAFLPMGMDGVGFLLFSVFLFCVATALLILRITKKNSILKSIRQRENVYAVSLPIHGTRSYYDDSDDSPATLHYIYSEPNLICVPQKIFDAAAPNKNLIGAVIDTGKEKLFYALYID